MGELDAAIDKSHGKVLGPLAAARVNSVFDSVKDDVLLIAATTPKGRKRRVDSTMWSTIVRHRWTKGKQTAAGEQVVEMTQTTRRGRVVAQSHETHELTINHHHQCKESEWSRERRGAMSMMAMIGRAGADESASVTSATWR